MEDVRTTYKFSDRKTQKERDKLEKLAVGETIIL